MDPHSTRSQFNRRTTKAGPASRNISEKVSSPDSVKMPPKKKAKTDSGTSTSVRRPIVANSRFRQDELMKRDMYLSFATNALQQKSQGESASFDELVGQFNLFASPSSSTSGKRSSSDQQQSSVNTTEVRLWLVALSHVVSRLERVHATLVDAIVNMPWMTLDNATVKTYTVFVGMLISARPEYLFSVLAKIAKGFTYQSGIQALDASIPSTSNAPLTRRTIYDRIHYLLRHLLSLVPTLPSTLQPLIVQHFPHKRRDQVSQITYIRNLLRLSSYCPELSDKILAIIVDRAVQMDVEIQIELEEMEEEENLEDDDVFELDPFDVVVGQEPDSSSDSGSEAGDDTFSDLSSEADGDLDDAPPVNVTENVRNIQEMVKKLDAILLLLFEHFDQTRIGASDNLVRSVASRFSSPLELPPLPPLEVHTPGTNGLLTPLLGPPFTQASHIDPFNFTLRLSSTLSSPVSETLTTDTPTSKPNPKPTNKERDKAALRTQFHTLLSIFDRTILRTFKSRYTQFLLFWYTSLDPEFADIFQGMLVERALMPGSGPSIIPPTSLNGEGGDDTSSKSANANAHMLTPEVTRSAAASYIGSFVSRAKFVDRESTRRVVGVLCEYLKAHLDGVDEALRAELGSDWSSSFSSASSILGSGQHMVFYAVAQAVFLIFCFRWRDLLVDEDDEEDYGFRSPTKAGHKKTSINTEGTRKDKWIPELAILKRTVISVLNPLKVCSANVVMQFARVSHATDFLYCYTILDSNKRSDVSNHPPPRGGDQPPNSPTLAKINPRVLFESTTNHAELNTFFPFDPYRLPKSNVFIQSVYREWQSVAIEGSEDDDDDEEEESDDDGARDEEAASEGSSGYLAIPMRKVDAEDDGGLGASLGVMSISPVRDPMLMSVGVNS